MKEIKFFRLLISALIVFQSCEIVDNDEDKHKLIAMVEEKLKNRNEKSI